MLSFQMLLPIYTRGRKQENGRIKSPVLKHNTVTSACNSFQHGLVDPVFNAPTMVIDGEEIFMFVIRKLRINAVCS